VKYSNSLISPPSTPTAASIHGRCRKLRRSRAVAEQELRRAAALRDEAGGPLKRDEAQRRIDAAQKRITLIDHALERLSEPRGQVEEEAL
jgi:hypothetical protein